MSEKPKFYCECPECDGTGDLEVPHTLIRCYDCHGTGVIPIDIKPVRELVEMLEHVPGAVRGRHKAIARVRKLLGGEK